jgi:hypothetical protein
LNELVTLFLARSYIAVSDLCGLLSDGKNDAEIRKMWNDGLNEIHSEDKEKITFEEFKTLLKGRADGLAKRRSRQLSRVALGLSAEECDEVQISLSSESSSLIRVPEDKHIEHSESSLIKVTEG